MTVLTDLGPNNTTWVKPRSHTHSHILCWGPIVVRVRFSGSSWPCPCYFSVSQNADRDYQASLGLKLLKWMQPYWGNTLFNASYPKYFPSCFICDICHLWNNLQPVWWTFKWETSVKEKTVPKWQRFNILTVLRSNGKIHVFHFFAYIIWRLCAYVCDRECETEY